MDQATKQSNWVRLFSVANDFDSWGQIAEAEEAYTKLITQIQTDRAAWPTGTVGRPDNESIDSAIACLAARVEVIKSGSLDGLNASQLAALKGVFGGLFSGGATAFPPALAQYAGAAGAGVAGGVRAAGGGGEMWVAGEDGEEVGGAGYGAGGGAPPIMAGSLLPALPSSAGTTIEIVIDRIGLKDAEVYIDPFIDVSVVRPGGQQMGAKQSTPGATKRRPQYINFNCSVHMQNTLEDIEPGSAVIFEFVHYKPKKKKNSVRCWCFIERADLKSGQQVLELYKKPTNTDAIQNPKKLNLHTVKPLYLHVDVRVS